MPAGRPSKMTPELVEKIERAFMAGCTDEEACCYVDIDKATLYRYIDKNPEFRDRKEMLKTKPTMKAKFIIEDALDDQDLNTAHRVIDRKEGSKVKQEITGKDGGAIETVSITTEMSQQEATELYQKLLG